MLHWTRRSGVIPVAVLLCALFSGVVAAQPLTFSGDTASYHGYMQSLASLWEENGRGSIALEMASTSTAIRQTATGAVTLAGTSRTVREQDRQERLVTLFPIAWDALVVIVHPSNPVTNLRLQELAALYRGQILNWAALGGVGQPISILAHADPQHGLDVTLAGLLLRDSEAPLSAAQRLASTDDLIRAVESDPAAVAVVNYSRARRAQVRLLQIEGQAVNPGSIQSGDYLLYFPLYLGVRSAIQNRRDIRQFLRFSASSEARRVLRRNGVIPYPEGMGLTSRQLERAGLLDGLRIDG